MLMNHLTTIEIQYTDKVLLVFTSAYTILKNTYGKLNEVKCYE